MVTADSICVGDYIHGLGRVHNVRSFCSIKASNKSGDVDRSEPYWRHVSAELNACYDLVADRVVVEADFGTRCFFNETLVDVFSMKMPLSAAA